MKTKQTVLNKTEFRRGVNELTWYAIANLVRSDSFILDDFTKNLLREIHDKAITLRAIVENIPTLEFSENVNTNEKSA